MKKIIIILAITILLVNLVSAGITVSPQTINMKITKNEITTVPLTITNLGTESIYNISIDGNIMFDLDKIDLLPNESKTTNMEILASETFPEQTFNPKIIYYIRTPNTRLPNTKYINISNTGFSPTTIEIYQQDTIQWTNRDSISHTVTESSITPRFDQIIIPGSSWSYTFSSIETVDYLDTVSGYGGVILVNNNSIYDYIHNSDNDLTMQLVLESEYIATTIETTLYSTNMTIDYDKQKDTTINIENTGSETAINIGLSANKWVSFSQNNFSIDSDSNKIIILTVDPIIVSTEETNKTHTLDITLSGDNIATENLQIDVFIPFQNISTNDTINNMTKEELIQKIDELKQILNLLNLGENETYYIYQNRTWAVNITESFVDELWRKIQSLEDRFNQYTTDDKIKTDKLVQNSEQNLNLSGLNQKDLEEMNKREKTRKIINSIIIFFFIASICVILIGSGIYLKRKRKRWRRDIFDIKK